MVLILKNRQERIPQGYVVLRHVNIKHTECFLVRQWWSEKFLYKNPAHCHYLELEVNHWNNPSLWWKKGWGREKLSKKFLVSQASSCHCAWVSQNSSGTSQVSLIQASSAPAGHHKPLPLFPGFQAHLVALHIPARILLEKQDLCTERYGQSRKMPSAIGQSRSRQAFRSQSQYPAQVFWRKSET